MAHSEKKGKRSMVNGEQYRSQLMTGLPFTVYCSPNALRSALGALPHLVTAQSQVLRACILLFLPERIRESVDLVAKPSNHEKVIGEAV
jgi:hypothetical protein